MQQQRLIDRLQEYWKSLLGEQSLPDYNQINPSMLHDIWPCCMVLDIIDQGAAVNLYQYKYIGDEVIKVYGRNLTDQYVNVHMHHFPGWQILECAEAMLTKPEPQVVEGQFVSDANKIIKYRSCMLPFATQQTLSHFLVGLSWREF